MKKLRVVLIMMLTVLPVSSFRMEENFIEVEALEYREALNSTNSLTSLSIEGVNLPFSPDTLEYKLEVPYSLKTAKIHYTPAVEDSIVEIVGGEELYLGNNSIAIIVTSGADGTVREYDITLIRKDDSIEVENVAGEIESALNNPMGSTVKVRASAKGVKIDTSTVGILKNSLKTLVYNWEDNNGNFLSSLTIKGSKVANEQSIDPNVERELDDEKLLEYVEGYDYVPINAVDTNIPKDSTYKYAIDGEEELYYLYYYENGFLNKQPLRNMKGSVEFPIEDGYQYALMASANQPEKKSKKGEINWIWPSIIVTLLVIVIFLITKFVLLKVLRVSSIPKEKDK